MNENATEMSSTTLFGFWVYLMTDLVLFSGLFATYAVLHLGASANPFSLSFVLLETLILLTSSFTAGLALLAARAGKRGSVLTVLAVTFLLGGAFVLLEVSEFAKLATSGMGPTVSGFFSSYFALVGTHGLHVSIALLWMLVLGIFIARRGLTESNVRKLTLLTYFWHFLDIVWICIFTVVYLLGGL